MRPEAVRTVDEDSVLRRGEVVSRCHRPALPGPVRSVELEELPVFRGLGVRSPQLA